MPHNSFCFEFEQYRLDPAQRLLTRAGQSIPLTPKATDILLILLRHAGQLVEKEKLINEVWPDTFVEESNVTQNIFTLRRALQDDVSGPKYIETVARRGYRFVAAVRKVHTKVAASETDELELVASSVASAGLTPILAVMAFTSTTGDTRFQYLAEGIPESIINGFSGLSQLRVISRSTSFRFKNRELDPQTVGQRLGADAVLVGKISARERDLTISVELVDVATGWQLWGDTFAGERENIFEIQDQITRQVSRALKLPLTREDEKRVAKRYTENPTAYQAYLEGRYHWSKYTRVGIENAIGHFGRAIDLDPNYALAYAGIVDCYLRLATNYLPPEDATADEKVEANIAEDNNDKADLVAAVAASGGGEVQERVKLRHEWDWKGAERELRRANELKTDYPAAHQWHAAYRFSSNLYRESSSSKELVDLIPPRHIASLDLTPSEEVQVLCTVAREQIEEGNYDAGYLVLKKWWTAGDWPKLDGLTPYSAADLLFTTGTLADCMASTGQIPRGHKHSEALLNGSLALCEWLVIKVRAAEVRIELGACYYRQGFFEVARTCLERALKDLLQEHRDLRSLCLFRLAVVDRHSGRLDDSLVRFDETRATAEGSGPWILGRYHQELGTTLRDLAYAEQRQEYFENAIDSFKKALYEFEAVGNHRYVAAVENNLGFVLLALGNLNEAERHLFQAKRLFAGFGDDVRCSQVNETLAQLYLAQGRVGLAETIIMAAIEALEAVDEEALLAEALITQGRIFASLNRRSEAKAAFDGAHRVAERCGHQEGAGLALLILLEQLDDQILPDEKLVMINKMKRLLADSQQVSLCARVKHYLDRCES